MNRWKWSPAAGGAGSFASAQAADMTKTLRVSFLAPETGFDPAKMSDIYSLGVIENIFDNLLRYDYLARPLSSNPAPPRRCRKYRRTARSSLSKSGPASILPTIRPSKARSVS